jgi:hypothetical protein
LIAINAQHQGLKHCFCKVFLKNVRRKEAEKRRTIEKYVKVYLNYKHKELISWKL